MFALGLNRKLKIVQNKLRRDDHSEKEYGEIDEGSDCGEERDTYERNGYKPIQTNPKQCKYHQCNQK